MIDFTGIEISKEKEAKRPNGKEYAEFSIGPVPQGYGYTLANSLRRVLLSSIPGYSITGVRINDLTHEFTTIPGIKENVLDIVLRLKKIRFRVKGQEDMYVLMLNVNGKVGEIKAGDITLPGDVEVINKDYVIATITDKSASFTMEATLERGIGYKPADDSLRDEIGRIPVDAIFSPVTLVSFEVVPSRKGGKADYDKVIMKIETDGGVSPEEALVEALKILSDFYKVLVETPVLKGQKATSKSDSETVTKEESTKDNTQVEIEALGLSAGLESKLKEAGVKTLGDLLAMSRKQVLEIPGVGNKALENIDKALSKLGVELK